MIVRRSLGVDGQLEVFASWCLEEGTVLMMMERRGNKSKEPSCSAKIVTRLG